MLVPDGPTLTGADPGRLDTAAGQLTRLATQLGAGASRLDRLARKATAVGPSVGLDRASAIAKDLDSSATALFTEAAVLRQRSAAQRRTSGTGRQLPGTPRGRRPDIWDRDGAARYEKFRNTYFSSRFGPPHGERIIEKTGAVNRNDSRIYFARLFIPEETVTVAGLGGRGDGRGYSMQPDGTPLTKDDGTPFTEPDGTPRIVRSKVAFAWRPLDGAVSYTSYDSRELDGIRSPALPLAEDNFKVLKAEPGTVTFRFMAQNSIYETITPSIDGQYSFFIKYDDRGEPATVSFFGAGDNYPSLEVGYVDRDGNVEIIGTARRGRLADLALPNDERNINFVHDARNR